MSTPSAKKVVLLGMMSRMPVAGNVWLIVHYMVGLKRLGYEPYYVEAHARTPSMLMETEEDDGSAIAAAFIAGVMERFGFADRWAFHALHHDGRCYGMSEGELMRLYGSATLILNVHGGTLPRPEHYRTGCLVYLNTDPVEVEVELYQGVQHTIDFLEPHVAFFTWGENYGSPDCAVPVSDRFHFVPTRAPVILDFWEGRGDGGGETTFTTIGNWRQDWRTLELNGQKYHWSKHLEFMKFLDLPARSGESFELALGSFTEGDRRLLEGRGWGVRRAASFSSDLDAYREYIARSRGEFTVAKDQNVRLRSGWFSERSSQYLAAGRPVVTQETGFSNCLPTGAGLFGFSTMDEILGALDAIRTDYAGHCRAARDVAREYFAAERVLADMLDHLGLPAGTGRASSPAPAQALPETLDLTVVSRHPTSLRPETLAAIEELPGAPPLARDAPAAPEVSIVVVSYDTLPFTKLCLHSLLRNTEAPAHEVVVVDNASGDGSAEYLRDLAARHPRVRVALNQENAGFARATNQGLALASGRVLVLLNSDTVVPPGWLGRLIGHLDDAEVGLVGPTTNRCGNEAEVEMAYRTYGEMVALAGSRARAHAGERFDVRTAVMFCLAMRRETYERLGPLDERFGVGMFEDDDYSMAARAAGYRVVCAEDAFVHHFGQASFGMRDDLGALFHANRARFEEKWATTWSTHGRRSNPRYDELTERVREMVCRSVPVRSVVAVVSRGDQQLVSFDEREGWHYPQTEGGLFAGHYPADDAEAIAQLETLRARGAEYLVFPRTALWWLDHYHELQRHLQRSYATLLHDEEVGIVYALRGEAPRADPPLPSHAASRTVLQP